MDYQINDVIYHNAFGFGTIIDVNENVVTIDFHSFTRKIVTSFKMEIIPKKFVNKVCDQKTHLMDFTNEVKQQGLQYKMVKVLDVTDGLIHISVGNQIVTINLEKEEASCTCSKNKCKHLAAAMNYLYGVFTFKKQEPVIETNNEIKVVKTKIMELIDDYSSNDEYSKIIELVRLVEEHIQDIDFCKLLLYCFKKIDDVNLEKLIAGFFYCDKISPQMVSVRFSELFSKRQMARINELFNKYYNRKSLSKIRFWGKPLYLLITKQYAEFIRMMDADSRFTEDFIEVIKLIDFSNCKLEAMNYMSNHYFYTSFIRDYISLNIDDLKMAIDHQLNVPIKAEELSQLDNDYIYRALDLSCMSRENAFQFLCDNKKRLMVDDKKYVEAVAINITQDNRNKMSLNTVFSGLDDTIYVQRVLLRSGVSMDILVDKDPSIKPDVLFKYFDYNYAIKFNRDAVEVTYSINFLHYNLSITVPGNQIQNYTDKNLDNAKIIVEYIYQLHHEDIDQKVEEENRKQAIKIEKANQKYLNDLMDKTTLMMNQELHSYAEDKKARLELYLDDSLDLKMRIGIDKFYVIKNLSNFVELFFKGETKTYGKGLTFTHKLENLAKPYDKLVEYLLEITSRYQREYYYYYEVQYFVDLNLYNYKHIFEILKGEYIYINDVYTLINLDLIKGNITIDEEYKMHTGLPKEYHLIPLKDIILVVHDKKLDLLDADPREVKLYQFILNLNDKSIKPAIERFKNEIFYHFPDTIHVAEEIKEDFKIEKLKCELYFDYNENILSVEDKYYIHDQPISKNEISLAKDIVVYNHIQNMLAELGFVNNRCYDESKIIEFFNLNFENIRKYASIYLSETIQNKMVIKFIPPQLKIKYESTMFKAFYEESDFTDEELNDIYKALKRKKKYIILSDDRIIDLSKEESMDFLETINEFKLDPKDPQKPVNIPVYKALEAQALVQNVEVSNYVGTIIEEIKNYKDYDLKTPAINATLREYQVEGYHWLWILAQHHLAGILADDMGLGKTIQIIALMSEYPTNLPSLIACPKSLVFNWINEFRRFAPDIKVVEIYGNQVERRKIISNIKEDTNIVYVTSYDSLSRDLDSYQKEFEFFIIDEAQAIKNSQTNKSKSVKQIKSRTRFALTGTPIENSVLDLWSIFDFLMPDYFDSVEVFKKRYLNDNNYQDRIIKKISPFVLRRTKKDVLDDLPEKYERVYSVDMNPDQRKIYDSFCLKAKKMIDQGEKVFTMLPMLTRLRQLCIAPSMFLEGEYTSGKMDALKQILEDYSEHKILIFSSFVKAINILEDYFKSNHIEYYVITGDTNAKERIKLCNDFNNNDVKIFLISLKAGGFGLNLTGADTIIHLDPWWNLSAENQASDRAHRIGQKKNVEVIKLVCTNSIEQRVIELQNLKKDIFDKLISSNDERITNLSIEDLSFILN